MKSQKLNKKSCIVQIIASALLISVIMGKIAFSNPDNITQTIDSKSIGQEISILWNSLSSLEFRCEEAPQENSNPIIDHSKPAIRYDYKSAKGGRRSMMSGSVKVDGTIEVTKCFREDGKVRYDITPFPGYPQSISMVTSKNENNTDNEYNDVMFSCVSLLFPGGRSVSSWVDSGVAMTPIDISGQSMVELIITHPKNKRTYRCVLDPTHDWMVAQLSLGSGKNAKKWHVEEFQQDNGRWFPARGTFSASTSDGIKPYIFEISNLRINRTLDVSQFTLPSLPEGVFVQDQRAGKQFIKGGIAAQSRLREKYLALSKGSGLATEDAIKSDTLLVAARTPSRYPWHIFLLVVSMVAITMAAIRAWKNR